MGGRKLAEYELFGRGCGQPKTVRLSTRLLRNPKPAPPTSNDVTKSLDAKTGIFQLYHNFYYTQHGREAHSQRHDQHAGGLVQRRGNLNSNRGDEIDRSQNNERKMSGKVRMMRGLSVEFGSIQDQL